MSEQADSARYSLAYIEETSLGVIPASALTYMRITGESLEGTKTTERSAEIRSDRRMGKFVMVGLGATGGVNWDLSYAGQFVPFFSHALMGDVTTYGWTTPNTVTGSADLTWAASDKSVTSAGSPAFNTKYAVGQIVQVKGTTSNGSNSVPKYFTIVTVAAAKLTFTETVVDESNTSAAITGSMIRNGTTKRSMTIEANAQDLTTVFIAYEGLRVSQMTMEMAARATIKGSFSFMGLKAVSGATSVGTGAVSAATTGDVMDASNNVGTVTMDGTAFTRGLTRVGLTLNNNTRERPAIGSVYNIGIGVGRCHISGTMDAYFEDLTLYTKYTAHTALKLSWKATASDGCYFFTLPAIKLGSDRPNAAAADADVIEGITWESDLSASAYDIQIDRFAA